MEDSIEKAKGLIEMFLNIMRFYNKPIVIKGGSSTMEGDRVRQGFALDEGWPLH